MKHEDAVHALAGRLAEGRACLFAGSGLTCETGGATWSTLLERLGDQFDFKSNISDLFIRMKALKRQVGEATLYAAVQEFLSAAHLSQKRASLVRLPWRVIFTTNYDMAIESALDKEPGPLPSRTVSAGEEILSPGHQTEMPIVKLMGSADVPFSQRGAMVIDSANLALAKDERARIFGALETYAANLSFLFVGYSFTDDVILHVLDRIENAIGHPRDSLFAVLKTEPSDDQKEILETYGIEVIVTDPDTFIDDLVHAVSRLDVEDLSEARIAIGDSFLTISSDAVRDLEPDHIPVTMHQLRASSSPADFFHGRSNSLYPFMEDWYFSSPALKELAGKVSEAVRAEQTQVFCSRGPPGFGRSIAIQATAARIVRDNAWVAIEITKNCIRPIPRVAHLRNFHEAIVRASEEDNTPGILLYATHPLEDNHLAQFRRVARDVDFPLILLFESTVGAVAEDDAAMEPINYVSFGQRFSQEDTERLVDYLVATTTRFKFPAISREEAARVVSEERDFLAILYRTLDPARRSIGQIISEAFSEVEPGPKELVKLVALPGTSEVDVPINVARRALANALRREVDYPELFEFIEQSNGLLGDRQDRRTNPLVYTYHPIAARFLIDRLATTEIDALARNLATVVDVHVLCDSDFARKWLIAKGVNVRAPSERVLSAEGLEKSILAIMERTPARPLLHHLARLYAQIDYNDSRVIPLLQRALLEPPEDYAFWEPKENVMTTIARVMWNQRKATLLGGDGRDPMLAEIRDYLAQAKEWKGNPHPYDFEARILVELANNTTGEAQTILKQEALDIVQQGIEIARESDDSAKLEEIRLEILSAIDPEEAESLAEKAAANGDGSGYAVLAALEYHKNGNPMKALTHLDKSIACDSFPPSAGFLKAQIVLEEFKPPDYRSLLQLIESCRAQPGFERTWRTEYISAVAYLINGQSGDARACFGRSSRWWSVTQRPVEIFWWESGSRKTFNGRVGNTMTAKEGRIYAHGVAGWDNDFLFLVREQPKRDEIKPGMSVRFNLGFTPKGPLAFDLDPVQTLARSRARHGS